MSSQENRSPISKEPEKSTGPFLAKVVSHLDPSYMGTLEVELLKEVGNQPRASGQLRQVKYMSPFMGSTAVEFTRIQDDYNSTQKSYGMWMIPPDVGTTVMVIFVQGDPKRGYWIGCVQDHDINFMTPGYAATNFTLDQNAKPDLKGRLGRIPVAEYNKEIQNQTGTDASLLKKPRHPFADILEQQGLLLDDIRGITSSSARREWPSAVFGISTPGPIDKQNNAPKGKLGKKQTETTAFVSRLGGSSFVMDDGDDKFLRKSSPSEGPPEYASVEQDETNGNVTIPHNELIRLRTRTGHQILLHNSEDLIYIGNARGSTWIELTSDGKIDIFAQDSISIHSGNDFNFYADRDINMECGRNFNVKVAENMQTEVGGDQTLIVDGLQSNHVKDDVNTTFDGNYLHTILGNFDLSTDGNNKLTAGGNSELNSGGNNVITAGGGLDIKSGGASKWTGGGATSIGGASLVLSGSTINLNGPAAPTAATAATAAKAEVPEPLSTHGVPDEQGDEFVQTIMQRVPTAEPWPHHENLDPLNFKSDMTDREADEDIAVPDAWSTYTTATDTFSKSKKD
jgi:hypothetical protein